jgi:hypothetical protein
MRYWFWFGCGCAAALAAVFVFPQHLVLEIVNVNRGQMVLCADMEDGEEFVLSFIHSVNKRPVYETLRAARDHLVIVKSRFDAFGAGMPESSTEEGTLRVAEDGWLEWTTNRSVPEVVVRVGRVAEHALHLKGRSVPLKDVAEPGSPLSMQIHQRSRYAVWKERCIR